MLHTAAEGNGPVNALDAALRKALTPHYPAMAAFQLADYKVRILDGSDGTERDHPRADRHAATATERWTHGRRQRRTSSRPAGARWRTRIEYGLTDRHRMTDPHCTRTRRPA